MTLIPDEVQLTPEMAFERLQIWFGMQQQLSDLRTAEVLARKSMSSFYFPQPVEGTNRLDLGGGFDLKLDHTITRNVDEAALSNVTAEMVAKLKLPMEALFTWKPQLSTAAYRKLNDKQREFIDSLLDIKEGTPQLHIVPKADAAGAAAHKAAAEAAAPAPSFEFDINLGEEDDTAPNQFFKDGDGVWWLLNDDSEWVDLDPLDTVIAKLEAQVAAMTAKPKRTRKPRAAKAGA